MKSRWISSRYHRRIRWSFFFRVALTTNILHLPPPSPFSYFPPLSLLLTLSSHSPHKWAFSLDVRGEGTPYVCVGGCLFHSFQTLIVVILCTFVYQHALDCGRGTGIFLIVLSSVIIIIRGDRVCIWGSVYLDSFGEEDRDLRWVNVAVLNLFVPVLLLSTSQTDICRNCLCFFLFSQTRKAPFSEPRTFQ